jgi:putative ATPase
MTLEAQAFLIEWAAGDARTLLNGLERLFTLWQERGTKSLPKSPFEGDLSKQGGRQVELGPKNSLETMPAEESGGGPWDAVSIRDILGANPLRYDRAGDEHYNTISAFIKSIRGSDPDAGLYYLARMLAAGEDPSFISRRLIILAAEDVGNADPQGLVMALSSAKALEMIGLPEGGIILAQLVTYLALAPKSNRSYMGLKAAQKEVEKTGALDIPLSLRSGQTRFLKNLGYGKGYNYAHDGDFGWKAQDFFPKGVKNRKYYNPAPWGHEKKMKDYQAWIEKRDHQDSQSGSPDGFKDGSTEGSTE